MKQTAYDIKKNNAGGVFTIPNLLSVIRILLIPVIVYFYLFRENYIACACILAGSYITDIIDGIIARRYNMISDVGKILDPLADKLTQASMLICISIEHTFAWLLFVLLAIKELLTALAGFFAVRRTGVVSGAKWYGKACTIALNALFALLLFIPLPSATALYTIFFVCAAVMVASTVAYIVFFTKNYSGK